MNVKLAIPKEVIETAWQIYNAIRQEEFPANDLVTICDDWQNEYDLSLWKDEENHRHMAVYPTIDGLADTSQYIRLK